MSTASYWVPFLIAAFLINISPGPEMFYVVSRVINSGKKDGLFSAFGTASGSAVHVLMVAVGLGYILSKSLLAFNIIKILGAGYLIYLGVKTIITKNSQIDVEKKETAKIYSPFISYFRGIMVGLLNPHSIIFFLSFLPQFINPDAGGYNMQIITLGFTTIIMGILINILIIILINIAANILFKNKIVLGIIDKIMGSILVFLGFRFLFSTYKG